jgi:hypothetical protein
MVSPERRRGGSIYFCIEIIHFIFALLTISLIIIPCQSVAKGSGQALLDCLATNGLTTSTSKEVPTPFAELSVWDYESKIPEPLKYQGFAHSGTNLRLRRFISKLAEGKAVRIGALGGSITCAHMVRRGREDWFSVFSKYLTHAFPEANVTSFNGCVIGSQSEYASMCLNKIMPSVDDMDLVLVEYATNDAYVDGSISHGRSKSYERLLRKLLNLPKQPAVVLMHSLPTNIQKEHLRFYQTSRQNVLPGHDHPMSNAYQACCAAATVGAAYCSSSSSSSNVLNGPLQLGLVSVLKVEASSDIRDSYPAKILP